MISVSVCGGGVLCMNVCECVLIFEVVKESVSKWVTRLNDKFE